jgi:hypothetical protein
MANTTNVYTLRTDVWLAADFTNADTGAYYDPATVQFIVRRPDGTSMTLTYLTDAAVERTGQGRYRCRWTTAQAGRHAYGAIGDGAARAAEDKVFVVSASPVL